MFIFRENANTCRLDLHENRCSLPFNCTNAAPEVVAVYSITFNKVVRKFLSLLWITDIALGFVEETLYPFMQNE
jgi:hypothetical protein